MKNGDTVRMEMMVNNAHIKLDTEMYMNKAAYIVRVSKNNKNYRKSFTDIDLALEEYFREIKVAGYL